MRGSDIQQQKLFSYLSPDSRVPQTHLLRPIRIIADKALMELSLVFRELYSQTERPSMPPEQLFRSLLLQILYSIRSERMAKLCFMGTYPDGESERFGRGHPCRQGHWEG